MKYLVIIFLVIALLYIVYLIYTAKTDKEIWGKELEEGDCYDPSLDGQHHNYY